MLGVEPAANIAEVARAQGIRTEVRFLGAETGRELADRYGQADLVVANNVYAHVPDLVGFTAGLAALVKPTGLITCEFPHLLRLIERRQYDTIYHEHYQYLTLRTAQRALGTANLIVVDVEELSTHGGSLRVYARPAAAAGEPSGASSRCWTPRPRPGCTPSRDTRVRRRGRGRQAGTAHLPADRPRPGPAGGRLRRPRQGQHPAQPLRDPHRPARVHGGPQPAQAGAFLPGTHIPIYPPERIAADRPDYVLVLPWNLRDEISAQLAYVREWGGRLVVPIPPWRWSDARRSDVASPPGGVPMKVVLFCGGLGMRMREDAASAPKPMAMIGDRPLLWHVMRYYAHFGHTDFILCLGYGAVAVKDYFLRYDETLSNDFSLTMGGRNIELFSADITDWTITFIDTGLGSTIGERLLRVRRYVEDEEMFLANYADTLTDAPLPEMIERFRRSGAVASMLAVPAQSTHHVVDIAAGDRVTGYGRSAS